ncbi:MAG TPA: hypothetical protein VGS58_13460 [Candidatus Sulfopaludibacter sp.]|nr:hypothetical protein [Candidatus Sulfopaludibacter sp.]
MNEPTTISPNTLAQRLGDGRIAPSEGLRYATMLAESLRKLHDAGRAHGAVAPCNLAFTETSLELQAPELTPAAMSYAAPEVLAGRPADMRSDMFSFGAVLYELLTGRPAFEGTSRAAPSPSGDPAVDRLVASCMARDPAARCQRMQKVMLELKLSAAAARAGAPGGPGRESATAEVLRTELARMEVRMAARQQALDMEVGELRQTAARMTARLDTYEHAISEIERVTGESVFTLREQLAAMASQFVAVRERGACVEQSIESLSERVVAHVQQAVEGLNEQIAGLEEKIAAQGQRDAGEGARIEAMEKNLASLSHRTSELQEMVAEDMLGFERSLSEQAATIESARTAMGQTDDLVERVVEALESLQSAVLGCAEDRAITVN